MPQACTRILTCPTPGCGISRSTISKSAPALGTCTAFIFVICRISSKYNPFNVKLRHPRLLRKSVAKHGQAALGLFLRDLVLNPAPVLDEHPVLQPNDIGGDPIHRRAKT